MAHIFSHILKIEMLQATIPWVMKQDENGHYFGIRHHVIAMILALLGATQFVMAFCSRVLPKTLQKSSQIKKFYNFVFREHSVCFLHYKVTKNTSIPSIFNQLYFIEFTLIYGLLSERSEWTKLTFRYAQCTIACATALKAISAYVSAPMSCKSKWVAC